MQQVIDNIDNGDINDIKINMLSNLGSLVSDDDYDISILENGYSHKGSKRSFEHYPDKFINSLIDYKFVEINFEKEFKHIKPIKQYDKTNDSYNFIDLTSNNPIHSSIFDVLEGQNGDIIDRDEGEKEELILERLITHRDKVEKVGIITGVLLGTMTLIPSMLSLIEWVAMLPASILFFSLPIFMMMRKWLRGDDH